MEVDSIWKAHRQGGGHGGNVLERQWCLLSTDSVYEKYAKLDWFPLRTRLVIVTKRTPTAWLIRQTDDSLNI